VNQSLHVLNKVSIEITSTVPLILLEDYLIHVKCIFSLSVDFNDFNIISTVIIQLKTK